MRILREWSQRLAATVRTRRGDADLEEELRLHAALAAEAAQRQGLDPREAARAGRIRTGGTSQAMDALRDQRGLPWLDDLTRDVRHGLRSLRRTPVFTAVALLTLALGIGANTAIFTIVNSVILQPLGYQRPAQLMYLTAEYPRASIGAEFRLLSHPEYEDFRRMNRAFASVGAFTTSEVNLDTDTRPLRVRVAGVDAHLLEALRIQPAAGRVFTDEEGEATGNLGVMGGVLGGPAVAILSHELWQSAFGGSAVVGRTVDVEGRPHEIVGIMPPGVDLMDHRPEIWLPLGLQQDIRRSRGFHSVQVIGRLKDDVTPLSARGELTTFLENWGERIGRQGHLPTSRPSRLGEHTLEIRPVKEAIVGDASRSIWALQAAVAVVLLIACANLANLLLARAQSRRREFAMRTALGASRSRLFRQAMTEGLLLSVGGGALGVWLAAAGVRALILAYPASLPRTSDVTIDVRVLLFAFGVSIGTAVIFGLAPIAHGRAHPLATAVKEGGGRATGGRHHYLRRAIVTGEVALAVMLVVGAGLLVRTVWNLTGVDVGFERSRLATFSMTLPRSTSDPDTRAAAYRRLTDTLRQIPGVLSASAASGLPLDHFPDPWATRIENYTAPTGEPFAVVDYYQFVAGDYFQTMGIPMVAGRGFEPADASRPGGVAVVNETFAKRVWHGRNPIGQRVQPNLNGALGAGGPDPWHTVIGVAKDVKQLGVDREIGSELYIAVDDIVSAPPTMHVVLRTTLSPAALAQTVASVVKGVDPAVPVVRLRDMDAVFTQSIRRQRLLAHLLGLFAGVALLLAAIGTYGVLSYTMAERRRDIGIRIALGAARGRVVALVMKQGLALTATGLAIGLAGALGMSRLIGSLLFGVQPTDPATLAAVAAIMAAVAALACWIPAWRASRVDPNVVLRTD